MQNASKTAQKNVFYSLNSKIKQTLLTCIPAQSKCPTFDRHFGQYSVPLTLPWQISSIHVSASVNTDEHFIFGFESSTECFFPWNFLTFASSSCGIIDSLRSRDRRHFLHFQHLASRSLVNYNVDTYVATKEDTIARSESIAEVKANLYSNIYSV